MIEKKLQYTENLFYFFEDIIKLPKCEEKTRSYIINIFSNINTKEDLSKESVTLLYNDALNKYSFDKFQQIGDWLFLAKSIFPASLNGASLTYYDAIAKSSYYKCYIIMNKKWLIFEELADQFNPFTEQINKILCCSCLL